MLGRVIADVFRSLLRKKKPETGNPLARYFFNNPGRLIDKWHHYFEIYHRHFESFRGRSPVVLEIGVFHGGSLQMWKEYFGPGAKIVGIDVDPRCRELEEEGVSIMIGDQADRRFLAEVRRRFPHVDIVIDDGGHLMQQQITSFEELYPHVQPQGVYLCEDIHTSFVPDYGGGYRREGTFLEYSKGLIDCLYAWYSYEPERFAVDKLTRSTYALHFYDSVLVVEKRPMQPPQQSRTGKPSFPNPGAEKQP
jgi:SAM-dependent methyltransferase